MKGFHICHYLLLSLKSKKTQYFLDIHAIAIMNDIPPSQIINWDQTAIHLVPVCKWTMNRHGKKAIPIAGLDDK